MPLSSLVLEEAPRLAAAVVREWRRDAASFGWSGTEDSIDEDHLAELIQALAASALARDSGPPDAARALVRTAVLHGRERREDGFTEEMLFREYHLLRRGLWEELRKNDPDSAGDTILRIDAEITLATGASLRGYHWEDEEELDEEELVDDILERWSS